LDVADGWTAVSTPSTKIHAEIVGKKLAIAIVKLRYELFVIGGTIHHIVPSLRYAIEHSVGVIEASTVQTQNKLRMFPRKIKKYKTVRTKAEFGSIILGDFSFIGQVS